MSLNVPRRLEIMCKDGCYKITKCEAKFKSRDGLTCHIKRKTPCDVKPSLAQSDNESYKNFYKKIERDDGLLLLDEAKSSYLCLTCNSLFKSPANFRIHFDCVHLKKKSFSCGRCGAAFGDQ